MTAATITFDDTTAPQVMRTRVLTALADATLTRHAARVAVEDGIDVSPAAALAEVIDEAAAYWTLETAHGPYVVEDYRRIAADMYEIAIEQMPARVGHHVRAAT